MSLISRLNNLLPARTVSALQTLPDRITYGTTTEMRVIGNEITIYPEDGGERYIDKGYNRNDAVYSIVSKNAGECSQVRLYHLTVKRDEKKTAQEYMELKRGPVNEKTLKEMGRMKKAMTEDFIVDSPLARLLNKPNRYQSQSEWIADIVGLRELQGEGNFWMNIPEGKTAPIELMNIPKPQLILIGNSKDPWQIVAYEFILSGNTYRWNTDRVVMWKYSNPCAVDALSLQHLRGRAPLSAGMVLTQGMNEADIRVATSNKNGGASGLAFNKTMKEPTLDQKTDMRNQFNNAVNSNEMANKIAILSGEWGYFNFAATVKDQQLIEQYGAGFKRLCRLWNTPTQIFDEGNGTWDNQKQAYRHWIYSKIGPLINGLTGVMNDALLAKFGLDPERHLIDGDIMSLPAMATDLKELIASIKDAWWLTPNQKLSYTGYEESDDPNMKKYYVPANLVPIEQLNEPVGGSLDEDLKLLEE